MKIKLVTTFKQLYDAKACKGRYRRLAKTLGGIDKYGRTTPINLLTILEHNGLSDFFWTLDTIMGDHQIVDTIEAEGESYWTKIFWDRESATTRRERVVSIKRLLK